MFQFLQHFRFFFETRPFVFIELSKILSESIVDECREWTLSLLVIHTRQRRHSFLYRDLGKQFWTRHGRFPWRIWWNDCQDSSPLLLLLLHPEIVEQTGWTLHQQMRSNNVLQCYFLLIRERNYPSRKESIRPDESGKRRCRVDEKRVIELTNHGLVFPHLVCCFGWDHPSTLSPMVKSSRESKSRTSPWAEAADDGGAGAGATTAAAGNFSSSAADSCFLCWATWKRTRWCPISLPLPFSTVFSAETAPLTILSVLVAGFSPSVVGVLVCLRSISAGFNGNFVRWLGTEQSSSLEDFAAEIFAIKICCCWDLRMDFTWKRFNLRTGKVLADELMEGTGDEQVDVVGRCLPLVSRLSKGWYRW